MKNAIKSFLLLVTLLFVMSACTDDLEEYNKPAIYWYEKMTKMLATQNTDKADDYYASLQSEHIGSPLLPEATMIMALAHLQNAEYLLAEYFLDEYIKRYADTNEREFAMFTKIKLNYLSLPNPRRDQVLIDKTLQEIKKFKTEYAYSSYSMELQTMEINLELGKILLNRNISNLYKRVDKYESSKFYAQQHRVSWLHGVKISKAYTVWYRELFEGDGESSWYDFLIPETRSVVSRNSIEK